MYFVYLSGMQCFSPSLGKDSPPCSFFLHLLFFCEIIWYLLYFRHINSILCGCFLRRCMLFRSILVFFFLRFWLRLETTSRWVRSEFSCHWCCFLRRWFAVDSLCSSWFSRSGFWWSYFYVLFHSSRMALRFVDFILPLFIFLFSHLVAPFIADRVSGGSNFRHICYSSLDSVFLCVCFVRLEGCLLSQA